MGRIQDRLLKTLNHASEDGWCPLCLGCKVAMTKLVHMFGWDHRGTVIPWETRKGIKRREDMNNV